MDLYEEFKIKNILDEMINQISKESIDSSVSKVLMSVAVKRFTNLLDYISVLENKLFSTIESNELLTIHAENLIAENQRLSQISKY